jgi:hypothetical protein
MKWLYGEIEAISLPELDAKKPLLLYLKIS